MNENKLNKFEEVYKNNLLILIFFPSTFFLYFLFLTFYLKFLKNQT